MFVQGKPSQPSLISVDKPTLGGAPEKGSTCVASFITFKH